MLSRRAGMGKERVDTLLVGRGLAPSRERAQRLVMARLVFSGDVVLDKPGARIAADAPLEVRGEPHPFVSRGGAKLDAALSPYLRAASARGRKAGREFAIRQCAEGEI